jgi:hypothetical protein
MVFQVGLGGLYSWRGGSCPGLREGGASPPIDDWASVGTIVEEKIDIAIRGERLRLNP